MSLFRRFSLFSIAGIMNTIVDLVVVNVCISLGTLGIIVLPYVISRSLGFTSAVVVSFFLNQRFVFGDRATDRRAFLRFALVTGCAFGLSVGASVAVYNVVSQSLAPHVAGSLAALVGSAVGAGVNFIGYHILVFRTK